MGRIRVLVALSVLALGSAHAGNATPREVARWIGVLDRVDAIGDASSSTAEIEAGYRRAAGVWHESIAAGDLARDELKPVRRELEALGPQPADGAPAEKPAVAALRRQLEAKLAAVEARVKQADAIAARASALQDELRLRRRALIKSRLLTRGPGPLNPATWPRARADLAEIGTAVGTALRVWWTSGAPVDRGPLPFLWTALLALVAFAIAVVIRAWLLRTCGRDPSVETPDFPRRCLATSAECIGRSLVPLAVAVTAASALVDLELVTGHVAILVRATTVSLGYLVTIGTLARAAFPERAPGWRLIAVDDDTARTIRYRIGAVAGVLAVISLVRRAAGDLGPRSPELQSVLTAAATVPLAVVLAGLLPRRLWERADAAAVPDARWQTLHLVAGLTVLAMPVAALSGWTELAYGLTRAALLFAFVFIGFLLVRTLVGALLAMALAPPAARHAGLRQSLGEEGRTTALFWLRFLTDVALAVAAAVVWLLWIGLPASLLAFWIGSALQGVQIGSYHVTIADVLLALLAFALILGATGALRRLLEERFLPRTHMGMGARHSLTAAVYYVGLVVASAVAISMLGLDLSNLALIAGALSVGIGFGLQNVVNNFVSGLIMLFARPIKVGDWVVVASYEGTVKRIDVRATEIETFQRAAVIIPNADVLSAAIVNWTHRDRYARLEVKVGVAYGSDVDRVREVLLACAKAHPEIASIPIPYVLFTDFGGSALDFELRAFLANNERRLGVMSDLRFAIDAAFRRNGIEIPFSQHDLHLRDLDRLEGMLRGGPAASAVGTAAPRGAAPAPSPRAERESGDAGGEG